MDDERNRGSLAALLAQRQRWTFLPTLSWWFSNPFARAATVVLPPVMVGLWAATTRLAWLALSAASVGSSYLALGMIERLLRVFSRRRESCTG